ncbi:DUF305 domain-containing protein [Aureimonas sp. Leaf324]|uniref:CopM family metallochaperone n=1 Tax=Aureimonas sp. Leaf324 TaxID=1736336 RepID=UPI0006FABDA5|nr:DUF305 domain-containing protein [Aureimonas sp. Leaf324]KQQ91024.1 hypothetical protein ASF65_00340 [Aureimonas sp. Leaf324]
MRIRSSTSRLGTTLACIVPAILMPTLAQAHVKWFAPYIVGAPPAPVSRTAADPWFWAAIALVLVFFVGTRLVERSAAGEGILRGMDRVTDPLWTRLDDFVCVVVGAFFVAIFAVGGVYLTPDLKTPNEWVSWVQLLIAFGVFSKRTMPLSAAGIIFLWVIALRDYDFFHLLDYLALGLGVAAYLVLASSTKPEWRKHRFEALRWGVAIALMWSSLEKFAYPDWFYPLVEEKPFLTFGMPRDVFIPMAGVAEFTMGFGLIWTPLVRRLSAIALFLIMGAAVYPFGRVDLIGHALIMAIFVAIAADHTREVHFLPAIKRSLAGVPAGIAAALVIFVTGYWGLHIAFYGLEGRAVAMPTEMATHTYSPEHPHGPKALESVVSGELEGGMHMSHGQTTSAPGGGATAAYAATMATMHGPMMEGMRHPDPDVAFVLGMIPHHQGAIDMAKVQLQYGADPSNKALAEHIILEQQQEIDAMTDWLRQRGVTAPSR